MPPLHHTIKDRVSNTVRFVVTPATAAYDAVVVAVKHREFLELGREGLLKYLKEDNDILYDLKETL